MIETTSELQPTLRHKVSRRSGSPPATAARDHHQRADWIPTLTATSAARYSLAQVQSRSSADWRRAQSEHLLSLFQRMASDVPAYRRFLNDRGVHPLRIRSIDDVLSLPETSKANYLHANPFSDLFWNGATRVPHVLTSTSGSTGTPTYFARSQAVDDQSSLIHEIILNASSLTNDEPTLVVVCFGMGVWIGGLITYQAFERLARRGYPLSLLTPGINKAEILKALRDLAPHYRQLVLAGYPPFLKDVLDEAVAAGISFERHRVLLLFAAEAFTEEFRDYVARKANVANPLTDTVNIYGSADIGTMAFETPLAILARRLAVKNASLFSSLFRGVTKTPTLAQFMPEFVTFEAHNGDILLYGDSAVPLMRYSIGDHGGVYSFEEIVELFADHGVDLRRKAHAAGVDQHMYELPFVYVYERSDMSTTLYGLQVYPETVRQVLLDRQFNQHVTGKLTLRTCFDEGQNQRLEINIEMRPNQEANEVFTGVLLTEVVRSLREKNSEFRELSDFLGKRAEPTLVFWPYEDPLYFRPGIKQAWAVRPQRARPPNGSGAVGNVG